MKKLTQSTIHSIASTILSFFVTICITLLVILCSLWFTAFQSNSILNRLDSKYYDAVQQSLTESLKELAPSSGLPNSVFDNIIATNRIKQDTIDQVQKVVAGIDFEFDSVSIREQLLNRFTEYAKNNGIDIQSTNLASLADSCVERYKQQVSISFLEFYAPMRLTFDKIFTFSLLGLSALLIVLLLILFHIHSYKHRAVRYCIYSLFASALMIIPYPLFCLISGNYQNLSVNPEQIRTLLISLIQASLFGFLIGGALVVLLGALLLVVVSNMRDKLMSSGHSHH